MINPCQFLSAFRTFGLISPKFLSILQRYLCLYLFAYTD